MTDTPTPRILITGRYGQLSWELQRTLQNLGEVVALGHAQLDLTDSSAIRQQIRAVKPDVIINAAAYTAVDKAESEPDVARAINATAVEVLADEARQIDALVLHYSSDYVFDGDSRIAYREGDATHPQSVYGLTKLEGEQALAASGARYLTLRTSWLYGCRGQNFLRTILCLAREREQLSVVDDQMGSPTWSRTIAEASLQILSQQLAPARPDRLDACLNRVYHLTSHGEVSWYGFAKAFIDMATERGAELALRRLLPISTAEYPTAASRPAYSLLSSAALEADYGIIMPDWRTALRLVMDEVGSDCRCDRDVAAR